MKKTTVVRVEWLLQNVPDTRNSDKKLIIEFMQRLGAEFTPKQIEILEGLSFESITRARRKIQELGKYQADDKIKRERAFKALQMQQIAPSSSPDTLTRTIEQGSLI